MILLVSMDGQDSDSLNAFNSMCLYGVQDIAGIAIKGAGIFNVALRSFLITPPPTEAQSIFHVLKRFPLWDTHS